MEGESVLCSFWTGQDGEEVVEGVHGFEKGGGGAVEGWEERFREGVLVLNAGRE